LQSVQLPQAQIDGLLSDIGKLQDAVQAASGRESSSGTASDVVPLLP
jgi:hypothetical protein